MMILIESFTTSGSSKKKIRNNLPFKIILTLRDIFFIIIIMIVNDLRHTKRFVICVKNGTVHFIRKIDFKVKYVKYI